MTLGAGISSRSQDPFLSVRSMRQLAGLASVSLAQRSVEQPPKMITCMQVPLRCRSFSAQTRPAAICDADIWEVIPFQAQSGWLLSTSHYPEFASRH